MHRDSSRVLVGSEQSRRSLGDPRSWPLGTQPLVLFYSLDCTWPFEPVTWMSTWGSDQDFCPLEKVKQYILGTWPPSTGFLEIPVEPDRRETIQLPQGSEACDPHLF